MRLSTACAIVVVLAALLACKSKSKVTGTVQLDGAAFEVKECQVSEATIDTGGSSYTTHTVALVDAAGRRLQFSDSRGMTAYFSASSTGMMDNLGEGCGTLTMVGSVKTSASDVTGRVTADCTGGGHHVVANFDYAGCGTYGLSFP